MKNEDTVAIILPLVSNVAEDVAESTDIRNEKNKFSANGKSAVAISTPYKTNKKTELSTEKRDILILRMISVI